MSTRADWSPLELVALLLVLSVLGERLELTVGSQSLSAGFVALVLAMTLMDPPLLLRRDRRDLRGLVSAGQPPVCLSNAATYVAFALLGGVLVRASLGDVHDQAVLATTRSVTFALIVFGRSSSTNVVNLR